jgi:hypothetical protein
MLEHTPSWAFYLSVRRVRALKCCALLVPTIRWSIRSIPELILLLFAILPVRGEYVV